MVKLSGLELLLYVIKRHAMFDIHKVDDFYFFSLGYSWSNESFKDFNSTFQEFIMKKYNNKIYKSYPWWRILKFHSVDDAHSLSILEKELHDFIKSSIQAPSHEQIEKDVERNNADE
jgi:hypothetical protein